MKYLRLGGYLFFGYLVGNIIADLVVGIAIPTWRNHLGQTVLVLLFGGAGAFAGFGSWRAKQARVQTDVHRPVSRGSVLVHSRWSSEADRQLSPPPVARIAI